MTTGSFPHMLKKMVTNTGKSVSELSENNTVLLVFLRHFGCTFCREALAEISLKKKSIEDGGTIIVFIHMADEETADRYFSRYQLENAIHISDPNCTLYTEFGLIKGNYRQLLGFSSWMRGFQAGIVEGHGIGKQIGDGFQMPGVFVIKNNMVRMQNIHKLSSDRPNYEALAQCCEV